MNVTRMSFSPTGSSAYRTEIEEALSQAVSNQFIEYERSSLFVTRGPQTFVIFGDTAYDLLSQRIDDTANVIEYIPALDLNGCVTAEFPEEGRSGILHVMRVFRRNGKDINPPMVSAGFIQCGWLRKSELPLTNDAILKRIGDEIDEGATWITGGVAG